MVENQTFVLVWGCKPDFSRNYYGAKRHGAMLSLQIKEAADGDVWKALLVAHPSSNSAWHTYHGLISP